MGGKTHMSFGMFSFVVIIIIATNVSLINQLTIPQAILGLFIGSVAGLLPDIDTPNSKITRGGWVPYFFPFWIKQIVRILSLPLVLVGSIINKLIGHRGGTHSLLLSLISAAILAIPILIFLGSSGAWIILTIWAGYISHLIADMMTKTGVPFFWPIGGKDNSFHVLPKSMRVTTKSPATPIEYTINLLVLFYTFLLFVVYFFNFDILSLF